MSIKVMSQVWESPCPSHTAKLVLLAIADHANDAGEAWPSVTTIATKCDLTRRGVIKQLRALENHGHLESRKLAGKVTKYRVKLVNTVHRCTAFTGEPRSQTGEPRSQTGEHGSPEPLEPLEPSKGRKARFAKPTADEIAEYGATLTPPFRDAEQFADFYEAKGWKVGREPMKDWKAAVRTWHRRQKQTHQAGFNKPNENGF